MATLRSGTDPEEKLRRRSDCFAEAEDRTSADLNILQGEKMDGWMLFQFCGEALGETLDDDEICLDSLLLMLPLPGVFLSFSERFFFWVNCCVITNLVTCL